MQHSARNGVLDQTRRINLQPSPKRYGNRQVRHDKNPVPVTNRPKQPLSHRPLSLLLTLAPEIHQNPILHPTIQQVLRIHFGHHLTAHNVALANERAVQL